jgi:hypothetical protein
MRSGFNRKMNIRSVFKHLYELTLNYDFLHEWCRCVVLNFELPLIRALLGVKVLARHSVTERNNFNLFYSDVDLTLIFPHEKNIRKTMRRLQSLKRFLPNIGEPEVLLETEFENIQMYQTPFFQLIHAQIFQVRKLNWQLNSMSKTSDSLQKSKIERGLSKSLFKLNSNSLIIKSEEIFPNCPNSRIRLNISYPYYCGYLECWVEIGGAVHEKSVVFQRIEQADAFLQFLPGNKYEDENLGYVQLKKYLSYLEIGKCQSTMRTMVLTAQESADGIAWLETLNRQIDEIPLSINGSIGVIYK